MTTNVHDKNSAIIASDSRWSCQLSEEEIIYIDDSNFEKMANTPTFAMITAGDGVLIDQWKEWVKGDISAARPDVTRVDDFNNEHHISVCLIVKPTIVLYDSDHAISTKEARFSGSGGRFAEACWNVNKCARRAIESAKQGDFRTGGDVKYVDLRSSENNLSEDTKTFNQLNYEIKVRGWIMNVINGQTTHIREYKGKDDIAKGFDSGALVASAPTGSSKSPWNDAEKQKLDDAINVLRALVKK